MKSIIYSLFFLMCLNISAQTITLDQNYTSSTSISPFGSINSISSLTITGRATLQNDTGIVRLILVDNNLNEYLLYEGHLFSMSGNSMIFLNYTDETMYLKNIKPTSILIIAKSATVTLSSIQYTTTVTTNTVDQIKLLTAAYYKTKIDARIATMNTRLTQLGYVWTVSPSTNSYLPYAIKRNVFGFGSDNYNNYSDEHWATGPLDFPPLSQPLTTSISTSGLKSNSEISFDWRTRHGATNKESPYYNAHDGSFGWINQNRDQFWDTKVDDMGTRLWCGTCHLFGAVAMVENDMNLYYNRHIDYDLSEKALAVCSYVYKPSICDGEGFVFPIEALTKDGLMKESCYPYVQPFQEQCSVATQAYSNCNDKELVKVFSEKISSVNSYINLTTNENAFFLFKKLIKTGPINVGTHTHSTCLIGWKVDIDNNIKWIVKNSVPSERHYEDFTEYARDDLYEFTYIRGANIKKTEKLPECYDIDRDGYYKYTNYSACPTVPITPVNQDFDDNDNSIGPDGAKITPLPIPTITLTGNSNYNKWETDTIIAGDVIVTGRGLMIKGKVSMQPTAKFIVKSGSTVSIAGDDFNLHGSISCGSIIVEKGGFLRTTESADINPIVINSKYAIFQDQNENSQFGIPFTSNYTESDRVCVDMDGDGYFNWGIGEKPATCPSCASDIEDGDDWNANIGEIDEFGQPKTFVPITITTETVSTTKPWNEEHLICGDLVIKNNSTLTLGSAGSIKMQAGRKLTIEANSSLIIQGGKVSMASIVVNSGGTLTLNADATTGKEGVIELCNKVSSLTVNGVFNHNKGSVNIVNPFDPK